MYCDLVCPDSRSKSCLFLEIILSVSLFFLGQNNTKKVNVNSEETTKKQPWMGNTKRPQHLLTQTNDITCSTLLSEHV